jgi:5'-3' exonuclease
MRQNAAVIVHLIDGTYELFRQHFGRRDSGAFSATVGVLGSTLALVEDGATHVGVATDHVIESFRNELWDGYKTSEGMDPELLDQIPVLADALEAMGVCVWRGVELEADDLLASAAVVARDDARVRQVRILSPDKDLGQCVIDPVVVQVDRRNDVVFDESGVRERLGVGPVSVPDLLALVGDTADGFPGLSGWGAKSAATVLARYEHLEAIPADVAKWDVTVRGAQKLSATLREQWDLALLFREVATARIDRAAVGNVDSWCWNGPTDAFAGWAERLGRPQLVGRASAAFANQRR